MFFRVKSTGPYRYLQIAHSVREGGKVRQQVIATLGRVDILQASGQFDSLIRSGARFCEKVTVLDAHAAGETRPVRIASIGPDLVFARLWEQTGIGPAVREQAAGRRFGFEVELAIYLTVLHRLFARGVIERRSGGAKTIRSREPRRSPCSISIGRWPSSGRKWSRLTR